MNFAYRLYYELQILFELIFLTISKYFGSNDSFIFCVINALYYMFDYNFFRIVNTSIGKYISVENVEEQRYDLALNFGSYDYIGFSNRVHDRDKLLELYEEYDIRPNYEITKKLEETINTFLERGYTNDTIIMNGGYQGNSDYLPFILENYDIVISHHDNHASIIKGVKKGKLTNSIIFNSIEDLEKKLKDINLNNNRVLVIIEGIYSMSGYISNLNEYIELKKKFPYHLYIDEAHSCGCIGKNQKGICDFYNIKSTEVDYLFGTFSKTFNAHGSYISGPKKIINKLKIKRNALNDNILPAVTTQYILSIYNYLEKNTDDINIKFDKLIKYTYDTLLKNKNFNVISKRGSPVICIKVLYGISRVIGKYLIKNKIATVVVGHPAVQLPYAVIRICLSISHTIEDIDYLISCLNLNADKTKLTLPSESTLKYYDDNNLTCQKLLKEYSFGSSGPCGFFGYTSLNVKLETIICNFTNKNTCIFMPNSNSGLSDIIENLIKRYKYKYVCIHPSCNDKITELIVTNPYCKLIDEVNSIKCDPNNILFINFRPDDFKKDCLKILNNKDKDVENYKFITGKLNEICNGMGAFLAYDEFKYGKIKKRTCHSSYVFSANLPSYIVNHNIINFKNYLKLKNN